MTSTGAMAGRLLRSSPNHSQIRSAAIDGAIPSHWATTSTFERKPGKLAGPAPAQRACRHLIPPFSQISASGSPQPGQRANFSSYSIPQRSKTNRVSTPLACANTPFGRVARGAPAGTTRDIRASAWSSTSTTVANDLLQGDPAHHLEALEGSPAVRSFERVLALPLPSPGRWHEARDIADRSVDSRLLGIEQARQELEEPADVRGTIR